MSVLSETVGCVWKWAVPLNPMVLLIIIPFLNGYNWEYTLFSDKPSCWAFQAKFHINCLALRSTRRWEPINNAPFTMATPLGFTRFIVLCCSLFWVNYNDLTVLPHWKSCFFIGKSSPNGLNSGQRDIIWYYNLPRLLGVPWLQWKISRGHKKTGSRWLDLASGFGWACPEMNRNGACPKIDFVDKFCTVWKCFEIMNNYDQPSIVE